MGGIKIINQNLGIYNPEDIVMSVFEPNEAPYLTHGTLSEFRYRSAAMLFILFILKSAFSNYIPTFVDIVLVPVTLYFMIVALHGFVKNINKSVEKAGFRGLMNNLVILFLSVLLLTVLF